MPRPNIYGHVTLRPVRVGVADEFTSMAAVDAFVALASSHWGGVHFIALPASDFEGCVQLATVLGLDVITTLAPDSHPEFRTIPGFTYWTFSDRDPFRHEEGSAYNQALPMAPIVDGLSNGRAPIALPVLKTIQWSDGHPLANLMQCMFGPVASNPSARGAGLSAPGLEIEELVLETSEGLPPALPGLGNLYLTSVGLRPIRAPRESGIVYLDPADPGALMAYWNLRAAGVDVVPWPVGHGDLAEEHLRTWANDRRAPGSGGAEFYVWGQPGIPFSVVDSDLARVLGGPAIHPQTVQDLSLIPTWFHPTQMESVYNRSFSVDLDARDSSFAVPLPKFEMLMPTTWYEHRGQVVADVSVLGNSGLDAGRNTAIPVPRKFADQVVRQSLGGLTPIARPNDNGIIMGVDAGSDALNVPVVSSPGVFNAVFDAVGLTPRYSDAGRYVTRVMELLGGVAPDSASMQPAVREVLTRASQSPYGHPARALVSFARNKQGDWPSQLGFSNLDYPAWVVHMLCDRGLLRAVLKSTCPRCGNTFVTDPRDLDHQLTCHLCGESRPLALHLSALNPQWVLTLAKGLEGSRIAETHPVMASLSVLAGMHYIQDHGQHFLCGVRLEGKGIDCEVDVALAYRERGIPIYIVGECKSYKESLTKVDVDNLLAIQTRFKEVGLECYILLATMRPRLERDELAIVRTAFQTVPATGRNPFRTTTAEPVLPLVLTSESLSIGVMSKSNLARASVGGGSAGALARVSCERHIGLTSVTAEAGGFRLGWNGDLGDQETE